MNVIIRAATFANVKHDGQKRKYSGDPYIYHPMRVAGRTMILPGSTEAMVAAAWLHDVIEDTPATPLEIEKEFGEVVRNYVVGMTNVSKGLSAPRAERKRLDREYLAAVAPEIQRIKLLDRIDNLRDMEHADKPDFVRLYVEESKLLAEAIGGADRQLKDELIAKADELNARFSKETA